MHKGILLLIISRQLNQNIREDYYEENKKRNDVCYPDSNSKYYPDSIFVYGFIGNTIYV